MDDVSSTTTRGIARITIERPQSRNALREQTCKELRAAIEAASADSKVRVLLLSGRGDAFCAGADLTDPDFFSKPGDRRENLERHVGQVFQSIVRAIAASRVPTLAVMTGSAVGFGFDLACACDLRVCVDTAKVGPTFQRLGLVPDGGGTFTLPRLIGPARALEWILSGRTRLASEVESWGLFNRVVMAAALDGAVEELLQMLLEGPPLAMSQARRLVRAAASSDLDSALDAERDAQVELLLSPDFSEGITAFFERRPPRFTGAADD